MPKDQRKTGRQNYDWAKIQHDYVTDPQMSLRRIAEKYGINYKTVAKKSKADNWFATRKKCQSKVVSKAIQKTTNKLANELSKELAAVEKISDRITAMLEDDRQFNKHFVEIGEGKGVYHTELREYDKVDVKQMKDTLAALKIIEEMKRSLLGIQRIDQIQRADIERERLDVEKERLELEREKNSLRYGNRDDDDTSYGIVLLPDILPEVMPDE